MSTYNNLNYRKMPQQVQKNRSELAEMHDIYTEIKAIIELDPQNSIAKSLAYENIKKIIEERF